MWNYWICNSYVKNYHGIIEFQFWFSELHKHLAVLLSCRVNLKNLYLNPLDGPVESSISTLIWGHCSFLLIYCRNIIALQSELNDLVCSCTFFNAMCRTRWMIWPIAYKACSFYWWILTNLELTKDN